MENKTGIKEIDEFTELFTSTNMEELDLIDQLYISVAYMELIAKVKPILLKHKASKKDAVNFLFKM